MYVHDNATNVTKAPKLIEPPSMGIGCLAHTINLAASSATKIEVIANLLAKARGLVTTFRRSTTANNVLKKKQELLLPDKQHHKLILDCPTRWNSSYDMLQRLNEQSQVYINNVDKLWLQNYVTIFFNTYIAVEMHRKNQQASKSHIYTQILMLNSVFHILGSHSSSA